MTDFTRDPAFERDSTHVIDLPLCEVRLNHNAAFPWIILIPRVAGMVEIIDLDETQQLQLLKEIRASSQIMKDLYQCDKLNVANLGNVTAQLHVHVIARFKSDKAWPTPIWNSGVTATYDSLIFKAEITKLTDAFKGAAL